MPDLPVQFTGRMHYADLEVGGKLVRFLIDFGYNGVSEVSTTEPAFKKITKQKEKEQKVLKSQSATLGIIGMAIIPTSTYLLDSINFGCLAFKNIAIDIKDKIQNKIGLLFFKDNLSTVILNNADGKYWLQQLKAPTKTVLGFDAACYLIDGKLKIVGKKLGNKSSARTLNVGDEIKSVNGRTAASFADLCSFIIWNREQTN